MTQAAHAGAVGYSPIVQVSNLPPTSDERSKYQQMWQHESYRAVAPGESIAPLFLSQAQPKPGSEVIDFGAGTGRGALMIALLRSCKVHMLDFADNCLDEEVLQALTTQAHALQFTQHDLTKPSPIAAQYGYCTDVLEHIPPEQVDVVLGIFLKAAQHVFFQISCEDDHCGEMIGQKLHLSVHDYTWWHSKLQELECVFHWSADYGTHCCFYLSAWQDGAKFTEIGVLNIDEEQIRTNVRTNIAAGWDQVHPYETNNLEVAILGGGPSLNDHIDEIKQLKSEGVKIVTLNGAYNWALEHDIGPVTQIMVDARQFNARFTKPVDPMSMYLIASQCDPSVLEGLPKDRTWLWHSCAESIRAELEASYKVWWGIPGGSTVLLRALPLLRMLGYRSFHLFGCDSCISETHHAYAQPENDGEMIIDTIVGARPFKCYPWMISQTQEFMDLIRFMGDEFELEIYGNGLLAWCLQHGYQLALDDESKI